MLPHWARPIESIDPPTLQRGLRMVLYDGIASQVMGTFTGGVLLAAFALQLGASSFVIGLISALGPLTQLLQIPAIYLVEFLRNRKLLVVLTSLLSRLFLFGLVVLPFAATGNERLLWLVAVLLFYNALGTVSGTAWNPWLRDLIPEHILGRYMARRSAVTTALGAALGLGVGAGVDLWQQHVGTFEVYLFFFALGGLAGLVGVYFLSRVPEPRMPAGPRQPLGGLIAQPFRDRNFRQLLMFLGSWNFAVNLAAPFFTVYMLLRLELNLVAILALSLVSQATNVVFFRLWGRLADRYSNKSVLMEAGPLFMITFLMWPLTTFSASPALIIPVLVLIHVLTGMSTAGMRLCTGNIALKLAPRGMATAYLAVNAMVSGAAATVAPVIGGLLATWLEGERLSLIMNWQSGDQGDALDLLTFTLRDLDFLFMVAFFLGLYALHRLITLREAGEAEPGVVLAEFRTELLRGLRSVSTAEGLRDLFLFPYGRLMDLLERRRAPRPPPARSGENPGSDEH